MPSSVKDMTLIDKAELAPVPSAVPDVVTQILELAANPAMDVGKLEKLIDMQERVQKRHAEEAFNRAFTALQQELPIIAANKNGDKWKYAPLEDIIEAVRPILLKHGFTLSHRTEWPQPGLLKVVGILAHVEGHTRESEFQSAADNSGSKNAIQALGSANHYGRRYTTHDLLGIVTRNGDDNGSTARTQAVTDPEGFDQWMLDMNAAADNGDAVVNQAWRQSKPAFRDHAVKHYKGKMDAIRAKAKQTDKERRS